jgi:hypothetical protein
MHRLPPDAQVIGLLGSASETRPYRDAIQRRGRLGIDSAWSWGDRPMFTEQADVIVVCKVPASPEHWHEFGRLRGESPVPVLGIEQLLLPVSALEWAQRMFSYRKSPLTEIAPYYLGDEEIQPLAKLDDLFSLKGKSVIEFGPFEGAATAGLVAAGVSRLVAIEARAENFTKTLLAREALGWHSVAVVMDDFHNADSATYGRFDLAFANGVYYHAIAPFRFFEAMLSLADTLWIGGYCATDDLPAWPYEELEYRGRTYRAKRYVEDSESNLAGINESGYFFVGEDLRRFFHDEGLQTQVLTDEPSATTAGRYLRFLATRQ